MSTEGVDLVDSRVKGDVISSYPIDCLFHFYSVADTAMDCSAVVAAYHMVEVFVEVRNADVV